MSLKSINRLNDSKYEICVEINSKTFCGAIQNVYQKQSKKFNLPGFRRGKAPLSFVEKYYGEKIFFNDAINLLYPKALESALTEAKIEAIENGNVGFDLISAEKNSGVVFKSTIIVKPDIKIKDYKNLEIQKISSSVTEEDVLQEIKNVAERNARLITKDKRKAKLNDIVVIDFEGFVDGKKFEDGKSSNFDLKLGSHQFIKNFEEGIIGHKAGDKFDLKITFPDDYPIKSLRNKPAVFKVTLKKVRVQEIPEIDDEFAKDVSEFDTLEEYKKSIKLDLKKAKEIEANNKTKDQIIQKLSNLVKEDIPETMVNQEVEEMFKAFKDRLAQNNLDIKTYLKYNDLNEEEIKQNYKNLAEIKVRSDLAIEKISKIENIVATDDDIKEKQKTMASLFGVNIKKIEPLSKTPGFLKSIIFDKTLDFLIKNSKNK